MDFPQMTLKIARRDQIHLAHVESIKFERERKLMKLNETHDANAFEDALLNRNRSFRTLRQLELEFNTIFCGFTHGYLTKSSVLLSNRFIANGIGIAKANSYNNVKMPLCGKRYVQNPSKMWELWLHCGIHMSKI